jgi:archaellum component FlaC
MTDTDERFDRLEAGLGRVEGRLDQVEGRLDKVENRLDKVEGGLHKVEGRLGKVEGEVQKLRVLGEENTQQIKLIAEVQSHHGSVLEQHSRLLDQLVSDVQPLKVLPDLLRTVIQDHERRITALEKP